MADSGKKKTPGPETKKVQDGGGSGSKKRRKHKKSGGSTQPPTTGASPQAQSQVSMTNQPQTRLEGATPGVKGSPRQESANNEISEKNMVKQNDLGVRDGEPAVRNVAGGGGKGTEPQKNCTDSHRTKNMIAKDGELPQKCTLIQDQQDGESYGEVMPKQENRNKQDGEAHGRGTPKQENRNIGKQDGESHGKATTKQGNKDKQHGEPHGSGAPKQDDKEKKDVKRTVADSQIFKERGGTMSEKKEVSAQGKADLGQKAIAVSGGAPDSSNSQQKPKLQGGTGDVNKGDSLDAEQRAKPKPEQRAKAEAVDGEQKSKAQLKAERRAVQEAQRAAKAAKKTETGGSISAGSANAVNTATGKKESTGDKSRSSPAEVTSSEKNSKKKSAVNAMIQDETEEQMWARKEKEILGKSLKIDNSILNLGFQYFHHNIVGANARCMALLATLREVITKYRTPDGKELSRDLEKNFLSPCITYINYCRPTSTSMGNAIKHLKHHINRIPRDMTDEAAISFLQGVIDNFIQENIIKAPEAVAHYADTKINEGDVILVYGASSLIGQVLKTNFKKGKSFRVIVVEGRPRTEGKSMLRYLVRCGIPCSYVYIGSASHAMSEATKVFLGASAMFAIGDMYSRCGNSMIAALAKANNIPVLVCCETYKFTDKVQLHSGDSNLHTRGKDLISIGYKPPILANWEEIGLRLLNLMYDVTGSEYITALVTELGMLPCSSVPVVLRRQEDLY